MLHRRHSRLLINIQENFVNLHFSYFYIIITSMINLIC